MALSNHFFKLALLCLVVTVQLSKAQENAVVVDVPELGHIRGIRVNNTAGVFREYIQFTGIPYAKSPEGASRFLPAEETGPLVEDGEEFDATMPGNSCIQPDGFSILNSKSHDLAVEYILTGDERIPIEYEEKSRQSGRASQGSEDCLNLNIHTPHVLGRKLPVIVFIHGGSFTTGNGYSYGPGTFIQHNVVLVTINYRLGVLGFFSLETDTAPGNVALYDMLSALRWVSTYIEHFGGDPNRVTVMGQSAGGAGVSHLMMSPLSSTPKPLFHRAIIMSSSALLPWATIDSPITSSLRIAELAGCYFSIPSRKRDPELYEEITECMKSTNADTLVNALNVYMAEERQAGRLGFDPITPFIQGDGVNNIITKKPLDVLTNGEQMNIPLMMGAVRHEGSYSLGVTYNRFLNCENCGELQNNATFLRSNLIPMLLRSMGVNDDTGAVYDILASQYLGDRRNSGNFTLMTPGLIDIQSIFLFKSGAYKNLELHARRNPNSYWYSFDHMGQYSMFPFMFPHPLPPVPGGVTHGDDLMYLFPYFPLNAVDRNVSDSLINYYRNFAYTGNPNIHPIGGLESEINAFVRWPTFDATTRQHLIVDEEITVGNDYVSS